jgi:diaminohydroxyphosphoribosylaminopyrimidine deaminase / 5-amino-6-(5-phosphoribosylamino)uracil reductase
MSLRPAVTLKLATSLDGKIATASGESRWITGPEARAEVHHIRAAHDAVLIGAATALTDDPELTARTDPPPPRQPLRVVMDTRLRLSPSSRLAQSLDRGPVLVIAGRDSDRGAKAALEAIGVLVALVPRGLDGVDLDAALAHLAGAGVQRLMVEGGGRVAASFLLADAVDRLEWFRAPLLLGADAKPAIAELALAALANAPRFTRLAFREVGSDLWETLERVR